MTRLPLVIERALNEDYSHDSRKRDLPLEATAHTDAKPRLNHARSLTRWSQANHSSRNDHPLHDRYNPLPDGRFSYRAAAYIASPAASGPWA